MLNDHTVEVEHMNIVYNRRSGLISYASLKLLQIPFTEKEVDHWDWERRSQGRIVIVMEVNLIFTVHSRIEFLT